MSYCEHCAAKQGNHFVQSSDGPFRPNNEAEMQTIEAVRLEGPFRLPDANTAYSGAMADWRDRQPGVPPVEVPARRPRKPRTKVSLDRK